ncbi:OmpA family protein [Borrelia miyamotoi]|uniref:OmpA family protein n=1 Tax=Borrelia miyamotoi TaxID=47466 RepID=A0AAX3JMY7_9SPIR|nr:OmpA family protein [Borrelia miyamotoi]QFP42142.1 OmpA family protein [Borrelia miyamotoi]QFP48257.1 OmpA family protein [Borrelia miyamotoi]QGT56016.1 OmpA family protein [Borrelia miyamotoi]QGT56797.1 OmpA family protein [Borrelia miyamotoi]WAZ72059.1 OmpA family protein [Borrelia miyamotoi]
MNIKNVILLFLVNTLAYPAEILEFKYTKGTKFRIETTDNQKIYLNGIFNSKNKTNIQISSEVKDIKDNFADIKSYFRVLKRDDENDVYLLKEEFEGNLSINKQGEYKINSNQKRPSVRGIPRFPKTPIAINETWIYPAEEYVQASELSKEIKDYVIKFDVNYIYKGKEKIDNKYYDIIHSNYKSKYNIKNTQFSQKVNQIIYFDSRLGNIYKYEDIYEFEIEKDNNNIKMIGNSSGKIISIELPNDNSIENEVKKYINEKQIDSINIEKNENGIKLSLDVEFYSNSFQIIKKEHNKLKHIANLLEKFKDNNILIEGHTTEFGTEQEMQELSEKRAHSIGNYLLKVKAKNKNQIFFKGWGAKKPKYSSSSPLASQNRRVEITILNN